MGNDSMLSELLQASPESVSETFREFFRTTLRQSLVEIMLEEVSQLCGPFYSPFSGAPFKRAGSAWGGFRYQGEKIRVKRPRVKDAGGREIRLSSYAAAKLSDSVSELIISALDSGVSSRDIKRILPRSGNSSSSQASRLWIQASLRRFEELRSRELSGEDFAGLLLDGIVISREMTAIVALGITVDGRKMMLDFEIGSTESYENCLALLKRLIRRGFRDPATRRLAVVLDGSEALRKAVLHTFSAPVIQRCQIHKERNVKAKLSRRHWAEASRLFKRLREAEGAEASRSCLADLRFFLKSKSSVACASLEEAGESLISFQVLNMPGILNRTFLSTNCIENSINNIRRKIGRVKRWRPETDQACRWLAFAMLEAEQGFRRIAGHGDMGKFLSVLARKKG